MNKQKNMEVIINGLIFEVEVTYWYLPEKTQGDPDDCCPAEFDMDEVSILSIQYDNQEVTGAGFKWACDTYYNDVWDYVYENIEY